MILFVHVWSDGNKAHIFVASGACNRVNGWQKYDQTNAIYICIYFWIFSSFKSSLYHNAFAVYTCYVCFTQKI